MYVNTELVESFLNCPFKLSLKMNRKKGKKSNFEIFQNELKQKYELEFFQRIVNSRDKTYFHCDSRITDDLLTKGFDFVISDQGESKNVNRIKFFEKYYPKSQTLNFLYIPILIIPKEKIDKLDKLCLASLILFLKEEFKFISEFGKIIYGNKLKCYKLNSLKYQKELQPIIESIHANSSYDFILNKHCVICEFQKYCKNKAIKEDHLSLLGSIKAKDIKNLNSKGIFTINQLSYTFRLRRRKKKQTKIQRSFSLALKALAIRERNVYIVDTPNLPSSDVDIYLDIEGIPERNFQYLFGVLVRTEKDVNYQYFWANNEEEEINALENLLRFLKEYQNYTLFHYGGYEIRYLKRALKFLSGDQQQQLTLILNHSCNILSYLYSNIYLPIYTNGLKDVGDFLGIKWTDKNASGVQSIIWRFMWETTQNPKFKEKLITYNKEDCFALLQVKEFIYSLIRQQNPLPNLQTVFVDQINPKPFFSFQNKDFALPEIEFINKYSYFDYQKEKVYLRKKSSKKKIASKPLEGKSGSHFDEIIKITANKCESCKSKSLENINHKISKTISDLNFFKTGIKKWIIKYETSRYRCENCKNYFVAKEYLAIKRNFGHNLKCWTIFQYIANRESFRQIQFNLREYFGITIWNSSLHDYLIYVAEYYKDTYDLLLKKILNSKVIYIDETPFNLIHQDVYAWVLTNGEEVVSIYRPDREGKFLKNLLKDFKGVLVSDFFAAYNSINCIQQKCLIHLLRDFNNDLLKNPFDDEYKEITKYFTELLYKIVQTIDRYGLRKRHLIKHMKDVELFYNKTLNNEYTSETARKYQKRIERNKESLFTFLNYDNISWNNTNAEHAIKLLARHRNPNEKYFRATRIENYLKIMSLYQTCKFKDVSFLEFLLSREKDFDQFLKLKCSND